MAGKYAAFIWSAYGVTALTFAIMIAGSLAHARRWRRRAEHLDGQ
jgi:heme exporter protein D